MKLPVRVLDEGLPLPSYARAADAAIDLFAAADVRLEPGQRAVVPTGIAVAIPQGYAGFVHARSGRAATDGLALVNAPGVIDSGYRGEIKAIVVNLDPSSPIAIERGQKVAQLVVQRVEALELVVTEELAASDRGEGGFGSSGR